MIVNIDILNETLKSFWNNLKEATSNNFQKKLTAGSNIKIENNIISCDVSTMNFKGSVNTYDELPTEADIGDAYNVVNDNTNYCWNGTQWSVFGNSVSYDNMLKSFLNIAYPVGSYYWSANESLDPNTAFGGEWERVKDTFLWAKGDGDTLGATGGEKTHKLTAAEMPSHNHTFSGTTSSGSGWHSHSMAFGATGTTARGATFIDSISGQYAYTDGSGDSHTHTYSGTTSSTGSTSAHNNMPPYLVAYCWRRIA